MTTTVIGNNTGNDYSGTEDCGIESVNTPETNKGTATSNQVFSWSSGSPDDLGHMLIKFSGLSNISGPATVSSATLSLYLENATSSTAKDIDIFKVLRPWTETGATWATYDGTNNWTTSGGTGGSDADMSSALATISVGATGSYYHWSSAALAALVEDWINGDASNYGVLMRRNPWNAYDAHTKQFRTKDNTADGDRPYLTVVYEVGTPQTAAPTSDISTGSWSPSTGSTLYGVLDEASPGSDTDFIYTATASDVCEVKFATMTDPTSSSGHKVRYRLKGNGTSGITVNLRQGSGTSIASWTHDPAPSTYTAYEQTLSSGEADTISDYSDLRLRFTEV